MIVQVPVSEENSTVVFTNPVVNDNDHSNDGGDLIDPTEEDDDSGNGGDVIADDDDNQEDSEFSLPNVSIELQKQIPDGYTSHRSDWPVALINVTVPSDELSVVAGWFSNGVGTGGAASETLIKRTTTAVTNAIKSLYSDCDRAGIFTRPFRLGYALRHTDGSHSHHGEVTLVSPAEQSPLMPITSRSLSGNILQTITEMRITPATLQVSIGAFNLTSSLAQKVTHLDFYATTQTDTLTGDESVSGVSSFNVDDEHLLCWNYNRLSASIVANNANVDSNFRIIGSVPIATAQNGVSNLELPLDNKNLLNWSAFEVLKSDDTDDGTSSESGVTIPEESDTETDPENPNVTYISKRVTIGPLDLGYPEARKRVRGIALRGIFYRKLPRASVLESDSQEVSITIYGAHHRGHWQKVASARGAHIRFIRSVAYRWWQLEVTAASDATIDYVTFQFQ